MRSKRLDLSAILKVGLSPNSGVGAGFSMLKNLRTNGQALIGCLSESVYKRGACTPFCIRASNFYITPTGLFSTASGTAILARTWVGSVKIVNLIDVIWLQDAEATYVLDSYGVSSVNPTGNTIPLCHSITQLGGQIVCAGFLDGFNSLDETFIGWSEIALDRFTLSKDNTAGFYNPNIGKCLNVLPMQDNLIVLGSRGACQMYYAGHIFGFRDIDVPPLKAQHLCASSTNLIVYISKDGEIVKIDKNGQSASLGYSWIGENVVDVKYLNGRNIFVFTTSDNSYLLDDKGMFSYGYKVWGEFTEDLVVDTSFEQLTYGFETLENDFGKAGLKFATEVFVQDNLRGPAERSVELKSSGTASSQGWKLLNGLSATKYPISGDTLRIGYISDTRPKITELSIDIQDTDRRFGFGYTPYSGGR